MPERKNTEKKSTVTRTKGTQTKKAERKFGPEVDDSVIAQTIAREKERKE